MRQRAISASSVAGLTSMLLVACTSTAPVVPTQTAAEQTVATPAPVIPATPPEIGEFGLDLAAGDAKVKAGDNFYLHASSVWLQKNPIPPDRTRWGSFDILSAKSEAAVHTLIEDLAQPPSKKERRGKERS